MQQNSGVWTTCLDCIGRELDAYLLRLRKPDQDLVVRYAFDVLTQHCKACAEFYLDSDFFFDWLGRHPDYEEFMDEIFEEARDSCVHRVEPVSSHTTLKSLGQIPYPIQPRGNPSGDWEEYLSAMRSIPACIDCLEDEENVEGFIDGRFERDQSHIGQLVADLVAFCRDELSSQGHLAVRLSMDMYAYWIESQQLTTPAYAFSVTERYIKQFVGTCGHLDPDLEAPNEAKDPLEDFNLIGIDRSTL